ncbi:MAG: hypothetical protein ACR2N7_01100 [Acidimicrobiia bacterium]
MPTQSGAVEVNDWSVGAVEEASRNGVLQDWVVSYMRSGSWRNDGLADGIGLARRWWGGPALIDTSALVRTCGPEPDMPYRVSEQSWIQRTTAIAGTIGDEAFDLRTMPPLIVEFREGTLAVADGNHRLGAFALAGVEQAWVIVWSNSEEDHSKAAQRLALEFT